MLPSEVDHRVDSFFVENIVIPEDIVISENLKILSSLVDLPYPLAQPVGLGPERFFELVTSRAEPMERYRALVTNYCKRHFEKDPDVARASEIARMVSGPLDKIFADQLNGGHTRGASWELQSPQGSRELREVITGILSSDEYEEYFMLRNRPLGDTLEYIKEKLISAYDPEELEEISKHLEMLAMQGYKSDQPVLLLTLTKYFMDCPLEANARFFLPFTRKQQKMTDILVGQIWRDAKEIYTSIGKIPSEIEMPIFLGGTYFFGAGSELIFATSAEKLNSSGLVFFPNVTKEKADLERLYTSLGLPILSVDNSMFILMIAHELGHLIHLVRGEHTVDALEVIPDLFSLLIGLTIVDTQRVIPRDAARKQLLLRSLAEFRQQARYDEPEYLASSRYFLDLIKSLGIADVSVDGALPYVDVSDQKINAMKAHMFFKLAELCDK